MAQGAWKMIKTQAQGSWRRVRQEILFLPCALCPAPSNKGVFFG